MTEGKDRQRAYRQRQGARCAAMRVALEEISALLSANEKPLAAKVRAIALRGLE